MRPTPMIEQHRTAGILKPKRPIFLPGDCAPASRAAWVRLIVICLLIGASLALAFWKS